MINVLPKNDIKEHTEQSTCDCNPTVFFKDSEIVIIHNSFDGREAIEMFNEIVNK